MPLISLKGFAKAALEPGEKKAVRLTLLKSDMGFYDDNGNYRLEDGEFVLSVGGSSENVLKESVWLRF